jgi:hypothetical protein
VIVLDSAFGTVPALTHVNPNEQGVAESAVRTNIAIEDTYLQAIMDRYGVRDGSTSPALSSFSIAATCNHLGRGEPAPRSMEKLG